ncbi:hypothetical protein PMI11_02703 [Rhizobium sp. CF142]|nr:hypothetical protein PMI11_02703 [Rhizobium sp. CF142]
MFFGELVGPDDVDDEYAFGRHAVEGNMSPVKKAAKAGAEFAAVSSHEGCVCEKLENPVQVEQIGIGLSFAEIQIGIFVNAGKLGVLRFG